MKAIALLGRGDEPTDGVADYCNFLALALRKRGIELEIVRVPWDERGWSQAMRWLSRESRRWSGQWVLIQYTALAWSRRGFPVRVRQVLKLLRRNGVRCAVVFHDAQAYEGARLRDSFRRQIQRWTMRRLLAGAEQSIFTLPLKSATWMPAASPRATFVPVGAGIPEFAGERSFSKSGVPKTVGVFCVSGGNYRPKEVRDILYVAEHAKNRVPGLRFEIFGRGAQEAGLDLEGPLRQLGVEFRIRGLLPAEEITRTLQSVDVLLCARGEMTTNRSSAIVAIACGVPIVAFGQHGRVKELDAAGIEFAPRGSLDAYADATVRVLTDGALWQTLHERNRRALAEYFSWDAIAGRYAQLLAAPELRR